MQWIEYAATYGYGLMVNQSFTKSLRRITNITSCLGPCLADA